LKGFRDLALGLLLVIFQNYFMSPAYRFARNQDLLPLFQLVQDGFDQDGVRERRNLARSASLEMQSLSQTAVKALENFTRKIRCSRHLQRSAACQGFAARAPRPDRSLLNQLEQRKQILVSGETVKLGGHKIVLKNDEEQAKRQITEAFQRSG